MKNTEVVGLLLAGLVLATAVFPENPLLGSDLRTGNQHSSRERSTLFAEFLEMFPDYGKEEFELAYEELFPDWRSTWKPGGAWHEFLNTYKEFVEWWWERGSPREPGMELWKKFRASKGRDSFRTTATGAEQMKVCCDDDGWVYVRTGPSIDFEPIETLDVGQAVEVHSKEGQWWRIVSPIDGYVHQSRLESGSVSFSELADVSIPDEAPEITRVPSLDELTRMRKR